MDIYQGWNIATNNTSGWFCKNCGYSLSWDETKHIGRSLTKCHICGDALMLPNMGLKVLEEDIRLFDIQNVYNTVWYHASKKENWLDNIISLQDPPVVHLGSRETALSRLNDYEYSNSLVKSYDTGDKWFLYSVKINSDSYVSNRVWEDADKDFPRTVDELLMSKYVFDIIRYVNFWERPGSISLLANPLKIQVVNVSVI